MSGRCSQATPRLLGKLWIFSIVCTIFGLLPWGIYELHRNDSAPHTIAFFSAGVFVCLAVPISIFTVAQHLQNYFNPALQKYIIRCVWMVPIYAIDSFISLRFHYVAIYFDTVRECYEAYVIYSFYMYLLAYMRQKQPNFEEAIKVRPPAKHVVPCCCLTPWVMGPQFLFWVHTGPISYVVCRLFCTLLTIITEPLGLYGEGSFDFEKFYVWVAVFNSLAQSWALYCLMLLYFAFHGSHKKNESITEETGLLAKNEGEGNTDDCDGDDTSVGDGLLPPNTHIQAIVVKGIVFVTFWQSVLIAILSMYASGIFQSSKETWSYYRDDKNVAAAFQDWLICVEMFFFALAFRKAFSHEQFMSAAVSDDDDFVSIAPVTKLSFTQSIVALFDTTDVRDDLVKSTSMYAHESAAAVAGTAKEIGDTVVSTTVKVGSTVKETTHKVAKAGSVVADKILRKPTDSTTPKEKSSSQGNFDTKTDGGTFS